jgi:hypothetical protein
MTTVSIKDPPDRRVAVDNRLHEIAWGLLLTLTGAVWLVPAEKVPQGAWLFGVAVIFLGVNAVRYFSGIGASALSTFFGIVALVAALSQFWRTDLPLFAICLIVIGVSFLAKPLFARTA